MVKPHWILFPFSVMYGAVVRLRNLFFDIGVISIVDVGVPVISVGNMTAGGTGKTPMTVNIVRILRAAGKRPAVVSRGYGRMTKGTVVVCDGNTVLESADNGGDEPVLIAGLTQYAVVIADEDRVRGARTAVNDFGADVIVMDDGFQHRYLRRTKDILLIDAGQIPSSTHLIPAGYRREPMSSIHRAGAIVMTKMKNAEAGAAFVKNYTFGFAGQLFSSSFRPTGIRHIVGGIVQSLEIVQGHTAIAVCGIAAPEQFRKSLELCGVNVKQLFSFPDHHRFSVTDIEMIIASFRAANADFILTTEKDAVRLTGFQQQLSSLPVSALVMEAEVHQQEAWKAYLLDGILE